MKQIKGKVVDIKGNPLIGANVYYKDVNRAYGVVVSKDGTFTIELDENQLKNPLKISYMGYETKTIDPDKFNNETITLRESTEVLDTVFVTANKPKSAKKVTIKKTVKYAGLGLTAIGAIIISIVLLKKK